MSALKRMGSKLGSFRSRSSSRERFSPSLPQPITTDVQPDVSIQLGGNKLSFGNDGWELDNKEVVRLREENDRLHSDLAKLREELESSQANLKDVVEERNLALFQNQMLIEMLAVKRVEMKNVEESVKREEIKVQEYKQELERCLKKIIDAGIGDYDDS
mmetsp:Transcript_724/g.925  ORF Transcript_724/g.925 Transcript_724/m.925 type:complete len:159 (+) Transcript_724:125-601(+)|eukprot:CAMPEP_0117760602 /NCGR_PEP_ID=MMETSP0947-20121206/16730_1 /TAXON_ID=44440 /ORGANISM="Chattonella subsalsa, Strain CCMP2191" /LENGTH=158 /DNA_ID=CAMNT_0005581329 /DNA_START=83 /DNA_END=559 /DNA_ORIENTATION=+